MTPEQVAHARALLAQPDATVSSIARLLNVSRSTIYKYVPQTGPACLPTERRPAQQVVKYGEWSTSRRQKESAP